MRFSVPLFVAVQLLCSYRVWALEGASAIETARQHHTRGLELVDQGDYPKALQEFTAAYDARPYFAVLYNIAQTLIALDRPLEAATMLSRYLKEGQGHIPAARMDSVTEQIALLEAFFGVLYVSTEPPGALVTVDGRAIGRTPLDEPVRLATGTCSIAATLDDGRRVERSVTIGPGTRNHVALQLPPPTEPTIAHDKPEVVVQAAPPREVSPGPSRLRMALPKVLGLAGAALAVGALGTYLFWERSAYERWQDAQAAWHTSQPGSPAYAAAATESNRRADSVDAAKRTVLVLAGTGGTLVAAGVILYLFDRPAKSASAAPTVSWNGSTSLTLGWSASW